MRILKATSASLLSVLVVIISNSSYAAIALDRTRIVFEGTDKSISLNVSNENKQLPYLVQAWIEDVDGKKINSPLTVVPPLQRVEAGSKSQVKVQSLPAISTLAQDRETLFYFNMREIPPRSDKPNTLQIALQTRIKLFYRPTAILRSENTDATPWQESIILSREGQRYKLTNPTPYYVTFVDAGSNVNKSQSDFRPLMLSPFASDYINIDANVLGTSPVLTYVNDYGGHPKIIFQCEGAACKAKPIKN